MNLEQYVLGKIADEAAKVAQKALAAMSYGMDTVAPHKDVNNLEALENKLNDLLGTLKLCRSLDITQFTALGSASVIDDKQRRLLKFMKIPLLNGRLELTADQRSSIKRVHTELGITYPHE